MFTENLPLQAKVHLGVGATRTGLRGARTKAEQGMWGEVSGTIVIPETAPWDRAVLLIVAFDAIFAPIGLSAAVPRDATGWHAAAHGHDHG